MKITKQISIIVCFVALCLPLTALRFATWETSMGSFTAELYDHLTPITANNFVSLANSGFYNGLIFHRVIAGFVIQDGCPYGTGYGGPGYTIQDEFHPGLFHDQAGVLAMARTSAPNSAGSQYYITLAPQPHLNGNYAIFGKVISGLDNVMSIGLVPTNTNGLPLTPVNINSVRIRDLQVGNITPDNTATYYCEAGEAQMFIVEAAATSSTLGYRWYVDGNCLSGAVDLVFETSFTLGTHTVSCEVYSEDYAHTISWNVTAQGVELDDHVTSPGMLAVYPNPSRSNVNIEIKGQIANGGEVRIYDVRGRAIRALKVFAGTEYQKLNWDGNNTRGIRCPDGVYLFRYYSSGKAHTGKCLLLSR